MLTVTSLVRHSYPTLDHSPYYQSASSSARTASPDDAILRCPPQGRNRVDFKLRLSSKDTYYRRAKEYNYRARSAYKLIHIHERYGILNGVRTAIDLCGAPGSWSQVLSQYMHKGDSNSAAKIVSVDLQQIVPIDGVEIVCGDITSQHVCQSVITKFDGQPVDLIVCDGAPDVTGIHVMDEYVHSELMLSAFNIVCHALKRGGTYTAKLFLSHNTRVIVNQYRQMFRFVELYKPDSSRTRSAEHFLVCIDYNPPLDWTPQWYSVSEKQTDLMHSDTSTTMSFTTRDMIDYFLYGSISTPSADRSSGVQPNTSPNPYLRCVPESFAVT